MSRDFMRAIFKGDSEKFDLLLKEIDINEISEVENWNYLHRALVSVTLIPHPEMIKKLIDLGVDVNLADYYGNTPLHYAARIKNINVIKLLLDAGAEIDHINNDGLTPLRHMLMSKPTVLPAIELLLSRGADQFNRITSDSPTIKELVDVISHGEDANLKHIFEKYVH